MRFWVYLNGWTKINVHTTGKPVRWGRVYRHEEGWSSEHSEYWIEDGCLWARHETDGRDCDGRSSSAVLVCAPLTGGAPAYEPCDRAPDGHRILWERVHSDQRDYAAEAAGY